jgi:hypothetical protein
MSQVRSYGGTGRGGGGNAEVTSALVAVVAGQRRAPCSCKISSAILTAFPSSPLARPLSPPSPPQMTSSSTCSRSTATARCRWDCGWGRRRLSAAALRSRRGEWGNKTGCGTLTAAPQVPSPGLWESPALARDNGGCRQGLSSGARRLRVSGEEAAAVWQGAGSSLGSASRPATSPGASPNPPHAPVPSDAAGPARAATTSPPPCRPSRSPFGATSCRRSWW